MSGLIPPSYTALTDRIVATNRLGQLANDRLWSCIMAPSLSVVLLAVAYFIVRMAGTIANNYGS